MKGMLICSNHITFADPVVLHYAFMKRRLHSLALAQFFNTKFKRFLFNNMNCIPVDRDNFSMQSFHAVCDLLKDGKAVVIFPEGQINREETVGMLSLKSGAVLMAHQSNVPIIPVYMLPAKHWYNRRVIMVGEPIFVRDVCGDRPSISAIGAVSDILRERELELKENYVKRKEKTHDKSDK